MVCQAGRRGCFFTVCPMSVCAVLPLAGSHSRMWRSSLPAATRQCADASGDIATLYTLPGIAHSQAGVMQLVSHSCSGGTQAPGSEGSPAVQLGRQGVLRAACNWAELAACLEAAQRQSGSSVASGKGGSGRMGQAP